MMVDPMLLVIAELQIEPNEKPLIGKSGKLYIHVVPRSLFVVTLATVLRLLWPLKMLKLSNLSLGR